MISSSVEMTYQLRPSNALEIAERRWQEIMESRPDLEPAIALQRRLVTRSLALEVVIDRQLPATVDFDCIEVATKLQQKTPVLDGEAIAVDAGPVIPFVLGFCEDLASGETGGAAERLGRTLDRAEIDVGSLLSASLGRRQDAIRSKAHHVGVAPDLLWLVAELASGPVAHRLQHQLLAGTSGAGRRAPIGGPRVDRGVLRSMWVVACPRGKYSRPTEPIASMFLLRLRMDAHAPEMYLL